MADFDLALAMAIAEDSDSNQDEDFQLPTHAGQLCMLRKLTHPAKRQKKSHCLSKKGKQKLRPISIEGKENQDQGNCRNGCSHPKCNFADPDLLQVRRPLAPRMLNVENRTLPSVAENSKGELVSGQNDKGGIALNEAPTHSNRSPNVLLDQPSETDCTSACPYLTHYCQKVAGRAPEPLLSSAPESHHAYHNQAITIAHSSAVGAKGDSPAKQTANDYHKLAQNNGDLLVGIVEGNSTNTSMDAVISLAEEENLVIDLTEQKQQQFEPDCVPQGTLDAADCLSQGNVNLDSQFNALLDLCVNSLSDNNEVDELHVDTIGDSLTAKDGSLLVEELISSLMTQNRESSVSCDVDLGTIEGFPKDIQNSHTEFAVTALLIGSQQTCLEAQKVSSAFEDVSDCKQADSDEKLIDEGTGAYIESNFEQPLECPVCGRCITGLSLEQREVHTNECLDNIDRKDTYTDARNPITGIDQQNKLDGKCELGECVQEDYSLDLTPVLKWLQMLNLSRYADVFVQEEIDWDTLKCLTEEDLITLGITVLGPRKKILYALQQLEKGRHADLINDMNPKVENEQQVETDTTGKKLITDFFQLPPCLEERNVSGPQKESDKQERVGSGVIAARKKLLTELAGIPEWMSIPGTNFRVDAFQHLRADCSHWFLTHFHTDHYQGLTRTFRYGHVYCSPITARLVNTRIGVPWERLKSLPLDQTIEIDGVKVTFLDANHCPGSVMILFQPQNGKAVLHTGDFRFSEDMASNSVLQACNIYTVILDTTYCNPQYDFPKQEVAIQFIIDAIQAEAFNPNTLFLIGTYTIGKERIFFEVAKALQKKIYCSATKLRLLQCMNFPDEDMHWLTTNDRDAHIHVVPLWSIASFKRMNYIVRHSIGRYNSIVSFSPTGWSFGRGKKRTPGRRCRQGTVVRYEVPYSEHCSFKELKNFVKFTNPAQIIPSVHNDLANAADALIALLLNEEEDG